MFWCLHTVFMRLFGYFFYKNNKQEFEEGSSPSKGDMLRMMMTMESSNENELAMSGSSRGTWHNAILDCCMDPYLCK